MKVLHASVMSEPALGVVRQLEGEQAAASGLGLSWTSRIYCGEPVQSVVGVEGSISAINRIKFKLAFFRWLRKESKKVDILLLRYSLYDVFQLWFVLTLRKPVYFVHHTLEGPELTLQKGFSARLKELAESILGGLTLSLASGIVAVTPEILSYELSRRLRKANVPTFIYPNGIRFSGENETPKTSLASEQNAPINNAANTKMPVLLFVSSVYAPWQGLEELLVSAETCELDFICHIVGQLTVEQSELVGRDKRFVKHGSLDKSEISNLSMKADIGLSALCLNKKNMEDACTLKVREYLKTGLAVYAGYNDVFPPDFKYFMKGDVDMNNIIEYAESNRQNIRSSVTEDARPYIEKDQLLSELYDFLIKQHA